ncbi:TRAP transporter large permease subunit [Halopseudomonas aestusnigri]|jgi:tripartite ATP-independent transporter DctM subunit|uniref:TRAP transporter large permease n=1 Tax=Halopseudomonas aestusnigri TaxID=857252 RepID=UPI000C50C102|nr:TRAP transporter large permease subunit [Halopseudomonas aestusnigri]MAD27519.1 C4-dicarboxylate ABC transporter [Pseudomonadales bacterium]MEE2799910.1 TRAP transporter large permease subunit [Pseudomonadota bacterium]MAK74769.1 C4-dicarboxylate ABC transporter [Pseudomonadales bacterium]MCC4260319.1 TRAP transporter large permease subunit [Halopseudomonas aestusnigri]MCK5532283.1 TRAP transporter large permease subunit [Halopseudomonas aestusnigri]|tara:strand:+ start:7989 stop:9365 length:1377 start_codon:yes stop_codon:yes gene_type:complete
MGGEFMAIALFVCLCLALMAGYPVAFTLGGISLLFAGIGIIFDLFEPSFLGALPSRLYGTMTNQTLMAVPLFVFMGVMLEKSRIAEDLLDAMARLFGGLRGGLAFSVCIVGALLAASTGIVGATVVTLGLLALPTMLRRGYDPALATGTLAATGTLGQIIPPSIILVLLGDVLSNAYQQAQQRLGIFSPKTVTVSDLFVGALLPGLLLVVLYLLYLAFVAWRQPEKLPAPTPEERSAVSIAQLLRSLLPPLLLIVAVLGSILGGVATPTEAAAVGALGAGLLALGKGQLSIVKLREVAQATAEISAMVFMILLGASIFSLVFRGFGGDELIHELFHSLPGGAFTATLVVMLVIFLLGFILDFIEITFVVVPIVGPVLLSMGIDPVWLGVMIALNLQTSFLTPPFGLSLFYLRGVTPAGVPTSAIYRGVLPFIVIQLLMLLIAACWPGLVTWLPTLLAQ